jgi:hypothetical protein
MGDPHPLDIPAFLKRDANNRAEFIKMAQSEVESHDETTPSRKPKSKANGKAPVKAADKPKAKAAAKVPAKAASAPKATAKPAKVIAKAKAKLEASADKDQFGFRKGSSKSEAAALYARKNGATLEEVKEKLGSVQLNVLGSLEKAGHTVERVKEERKGQRSVTRYLLKVK